MGLEVTKSEGAVARQVLIGMIVSRRVVAEIAGKWDDDNGLFDSRWANVVGTWCVRHYRKYGKAIFRDIEHVHANWSNHGKRNPQDVEMIDRLLQGLSRQYSRQRVELNEQLCVDVAGEYFNRVATIRLSDEIRHLAEGGKVSEARKAIARFGAGVEIGHGAGLDIFTSRAEISEIVRHKRKPLFTWPGALGRFMGDEFEEEAFVAVMAPEKRGKTWTLMDVAYRAMLARRRVAFFQVGDLSQRQIKRRFYTRICDRPLVATRPGKYVRIPTKFHRAGEADDPHIEFKDRRWKRDMTEDDIWEKCCELQVALIGSARSHMKVSVHPNSSINVAGIKAVLDGWDRSGWRAEVVVIDYADILAPPTGAAYMDARDVINETWKEMRRLSQERRNCLVTATQVRRDAYDAELMSMKHAADDKRKFAHVTAMLGINQRPAEKELGIVRYNMPAVRESDIEPTRVVYVAQALGVANASVLSCD